jgi:hypothetical protein
MTPEQEARFLELVEAFADMALLVRGPMLPPEGRRSYVACVKTFDRAIRALGFDPEAVEARRIGEEIRREILMEQLGAMFADALPRGFFISRDGGACPIIRVGPFRDSQGLWAVVMLDGRRYVADIDEKLNIACVPHRHEDGSRDIAVGRFAVPQKSEVS